MIQGNSRDWRIQRDFSNQSWACSTLEWFQPQVYGSQQRSGGLSGQRECGDGLVSLARVYQHTEESRGKEEITKNNQQFIFKRSAEKVTRQQTKKWPGKSRKILALNTHKSKRN